MSWAVGKDPNWDRWIGYGVPAVCDHPDCSAEIDRGLAWACCYGQIYGQAVDGDDRENGCGLFFCAEHGSRCERCRDGLEPFTPKPDTIGWVRHMLTDDSWQDWRDENPSEVAEMRARLDAEAVTSESYLVQTNDEFGFSDRWDDDTEALEIAHSRSIGLPCTVDVFSQSGAGDRELVASFLDGRQIRGGVWG